jgi:D-glycero-D-manno-heptose 1,7-bisphosphate phosphatase
MNKGLLILDRDGTLNKRIRGSYLLTEKQISLSPDISEVAILHTLGWKMVIATNQACISKGLISRKQVTYLTQLILQPWLDLEESHIYVCPHLDSEECLCRKPRPGMIEQILQEHPYPRDKVFLIGDSESDFKASRASGIGFAGVCWDSICQGRVCMHSLANIVKHLGAEGNQDERTF